MTSQDFYNNLLNEGKQQPQPARPAVATTNTSDSDRVQELITLLLQSGTDITNGYNDWLKVGFALAGAFGESGRSYFHDISSIYSGYDAREADKSTTNASAQRMDVLTSQRSSIWQSRPECHFPNTNTRRHKPQRDTVTKMSPCHF